MNNLAEVYPGDSKYDEAKAIPEPLVAEANRLSGPRDGLTLSSVDFLTVAIGSHIEEGVALLRGVIDNAEPNSIGALTAGRIWVLVTRCGICALRSLKRSKM